MSTQTLDQTQVDNFAERVDRLDNRTANLRQIMVAFGEKWDIQLEDDLQQESDMQQTEPSQSTEQEQAPSVQETQQSQPAGKQPQNESQQEESQSDAELEDDDLQDILDSVELDDDMQL